MSELEESWNRYLERKGTLKKKPSPDTDLEKSWTAYLKRKGILPVVCE